MAETDGKMRRRLSTVFGWAAGGAAGLLVDYAAFSAIGPSYPLVPATFALFVAGCFAGMWASDRLGDRAFRILGIAAGALLAVVLVMFGAIFLR